MTTQKRIEEIVKYAKIKGLNGGVVMSENALKEVLTQALSQREEELRGGIQEDLREERARIFENHRRRRHRQHYRNNSSCGRGVYLRETSFEGDKRIMKNIILLTIGTSMLFSGIFIHQGVDGVATGMILYGIVITFFSIFSSFLKYLE